MVKELFNLLSCEKSLDHEAPCSKLNMLSTLRDVGLLTATFSAALAAPSLGLGAVFLAETAGSALIAGGLSCIASTAIAPGAYSYSREVFHRLQNKTSLHL